jgi:hypothetical protein
MEEVTGSSPVSPTRSHPTLEFRDRVTEAISLGFPRSEHSAQTETLTFKPACLVGTVS